MACGNLLHIKKGNAPSSNTSQKKLHLTHKSLWKTWLLLTINKFPLLRQQKQTKHKYKKARIKYPVRWSRALFLYNGI